jgi:flagellar motor switch protein FliN/FliY
LTASTTSVHAAAADALAELVPGLKPPTAIIHPYGEPLGDQVSSAVVASFVGAASADLALALSDTDSLAAAAGGDWSVVSLGDMLRPAMEAAIGVLGAGVLGETSVEDATSLFADADASVFNLVVDGTTVGWFAIRIRETNAIGVAAAPAHEHIAGKLGRINSVEMAMTVEIGHTRMSVRDVLALEPGAVIELDRSAGAPADVLLNGRLIAHGEVVVVDQDYAVRITKILDVSEGLR